MRIGSRNDRQRAAPHDAGMQRIASFVDSALFSDVL